MPANRQGNGNFFNYSALVDSQSQRTAAVKTIEQTQTTLPNPISNPGNPDGPDTNASAGSSSGVGAGTGSNAFNSVNADDNPRPNGVTTQTAINTSTAALNGVIATQPNQLDQYVSYTYAISWYVLSPAQYNAAVTTQQPNVTGWQLLMQSGGAPIKGRSTAFPLDYYMDDLEIESLIPFGGTSMANSATNIRFKVTEPNGITLVQNLFNAVVAVYKTAQQAQTNASSGSATPNYLQAQYCLVIEFYGYDSQGNLVAPANGASSGYGQQAVIAKYYPFRLIDIKFQIANRVIEYVVTGKPIPYSYNSSTDRGTIPFPFAMTGQTVEQLLNGSPVSTGAGTNTNDPGRTTTPAPIQADSSQTAALFNDGTGYAPGYDPAAGWSA